MKKILAVILLTSCASPKPVFVERVITEDVIVRDTVVEYVLKPYKEEVTTSDTISLLENEYAITRAETSGGKLKHSLETKEKPISVKIQYVDRIIKEKIPVPYEVERIVKVEKKLNAWQKAKLKLGGIVMIIGLAYLAKIIVKRRV